MNRTDDIRNEIMFVGGLDSDTDPRFLTKGDWLEAQNLVKSEDGRNGALTNVKGTEEVLDLNNYVNLVGRCRYKNNGSYILFLKGDTSMIGNPDRIIEYNPHLRTSTTVVSSDYLNFNTAYYVKADMIGDWLQWTDGYNPVRLINVADTKDYAGTIDDEYLDSCRRPSLDVPLAISGYDSTIFYNNLTTGYQFKYRYVFTDYRNSVYSKASDIVIGSNLSRREDGGVGESGTDNFIYIKFNSGSANVGWIDVIARNGNTGQWGRFIKIDKDDPEKVYTVVATPALMTTALADDTDYYVRFYDNESRTIVADGGKQYDVLPDTAESTCAIGENRFVIGGIVDGKELVDLDVTLTAKYNDPGVYESWAINDADYGVDESFIDYVRVIYDLDDLVGVGSRTEWNVGNYINFSFSVETTVDGSPSFAASSQYVYITEKITSKDALGNFVAANAEAATYPGNVLTSTVVYDSDENTITFLITTSDTVTALVSPYDEDSSLIYNTGYDYYTAYGYVNDQEFKRNKSHKLGLVYSDEYGKKWPVLASTQTDISFAAYNALQPGFAHLQYTINHTPPTDAVSYRWVYAYRPEAFVQTMISDVSYIEDEDQAGIVREDVIALDVSGNLNMVYKHYNFEAGDYIRIIQEGIADGVTYGYGAYVTDVPLFRVNEVLDYVDDGTDVKNGKWLVVKPINRDGYNYTDAGTILDCKFLNAIVEVFKTRTTTDEVLYYEIGGGGACSNGLHVDWYTGTNSGYLNQGDAYRRPVIRYKRYGDDRDKVIPALHLLEDPYPFEDATSAMTGIGDPNIEYPESRSKFDNNLLWSNKFFFDTKVNGLSTYDFDDKKEVSDSYGDIVGIEEQGNSLTVICEKKVLSTYVGATEYQDAQGNPQVVTSDRVLGYLRPLLGEYGTFLKESIYNTGEYIYFLDARNGCFIRKTVNGIFPISGKIQTGGYEYDYKMHTYFKNKCKALMESYYDQGSYSVSIEDYETREYIKVFTGYDNEYKNLYVTFWDFIDTANNETILFHEPSNRWISNYSAEYGTESFEIETTEITDIDVQSPDYSITNMETIYSGTSGAHDVQEIYDVAYAPEYIGTRIRSATGGIEVTITGQIDVLAGSYITVSGSTYHNGTYLVASDADKRPISNTTVIRTTGGTYSGLETSFFVGVWGMYIVHVGNNISVAVGDYVYISDTLYHDGIYRVSVASYAVGSYYAFSVVSGTTASTPTETTGTIDIDVITILDVDYETSDTARVYISEDVTLVVGSNVYIVGNENIPDGAYEVAVGCADDSVFDIYYTDFESYSVSGSQSGLSEATGCILLPITILSLTPNITISDGTTLHIDNTGTEDGDYTVNGSYINSSYVYLDESVSSPVTDGEVRLDYISEITTVDNVTAYSGDYVKLSSSDSGSVSGTNDGYYKVYANCINDDTVVIDYHITDPSTSGTLQVGLKGISSIVSNRIVVDTPVSVRKGDNVILENTASNDGTYTSAISVNDSYTIYTQEDLITEGSGGFVFTEYALTDAFQGYIGIDNYFHSFLNGKLWMHNSNAVTRCNIYGTQQDSYIKFAANEAPLEKKIFNSIEIKSNKKWDATEIEAPANETYTYGIFTRIKKALFNLADGVMRSKFLRNMKTSSATINRQELYSGDLLVNEYLTIKLENDDTTETHISSVVVNSELTR
jgi:hypothetical protein